jgi:NADPH2:quinone reductase
VLIHGGASGIGTGDDACKSVWRIKDHHDSRLRYQHDASIALGADVAVDYRNEDFVEAVARATDGRGVDVVVDIIAGDYVARNYAAAAMDGRIIQIGVIKGPAQSSTYS